MNVPLLEAGARQLDRLERNGRFDGVISALRGAVRRVVPAGPGADALHGTWLGHPLHPVLTDVPIGAWLAAGVLDAVPGQDTAATTLVGLGLAAAVPTALTGANDWAEAVPEQQRIGLWHGLVNATATAVYGASFVARLSGRRRAGRTLGWLGLAVAGMGAYLGGHLAFSSGPGASHAEPAWRRLPEGWQPVDELSALTPGRLVRRRIGEVPVLVYRGPRTVHVLVEQCAHLAGPLADGRVTLVDDDPCVVCPWHGSTFRLADGAVRRGPATVPQPVLKVRVVDDRVEARRP